MRNLVIDASRFASVQTSSFFDSCSIDKYSETYDSYRSLVKAWTSGSATPVNCGVGVNSGNKRYIDETIIATNDITVRLPLGTVVDDQDQITILKRKGTTVSDKYSIISVEKGEGILILKCRKIKGITSQITIVPVVEPTLIERLQAANVFVASKMLKPVKFYA